MNTSTTSNITTEAIIIIVTIVIVIIFIGIIYAVYYFWGGPYEYLVIFLAIFLFIVAAVIAYLITFAPSVVPFGEVTAPGSSGPAGASLTYGAIVALDNPGLKVGAIPCRNGQPANEGIPITSSATMGNEFWQIQGGVFGTPLLYNTDLTLVNISQGFPALSISEFSIPGENSELSLEPSLPVVTFFIAKAPGTTSTSNVVMRGDLITLANGDTFMGVDVSDAAGTPCGNHINLIPTTPANLFPAVIWMFN